MLETYLVSLGVAVSPIWVARGEIFENLPPCGIVGGAAAMTLVNDDQVKKAGREFPEELLALLRPGDGLIEPQIDLVGGVDAALFVQRRGEFDFGAVLRARWFSRPC